MKLLPGEFFERIATALKGAYFGIHQGIFVVQRLHLLFLAGYLDSGPNPVENAAVREEQQVNPEDGGDYDHERKEISVAAM